MSTTVSIALIGDYNTSSIAHQAIPLSIDLAAKALNIKATFSWIPTESVSSTNLLSYQAIWGTPGSPYKSMEGALHAIKIAREF